MYLRYISRSNVSKLTGKKFIVNKICWGRFSDESKESSSKETPSKLDTTTGKNGKENSIEENKSTAGKGGKKNSSEENKSSKHEFNFFNKIRDEKNTIISLVLGGSFLYYLFNREVDPISGRKKFHLFSNRQLRALGDIQSHYLEKKYQGRIENSGNDYNRVARIIHLIVSANKDIFGEHEKESWEIFVILKDNTINSFALANQKIFVYSGLLKNMDSDDQLAALFAHEMGHVLMNHSAEVHSWTRLFYSVILFPFLTLYSFLPGPLGAVLYTLIKPLSVILMKTPTKEKLEKEADKLCIILISRACFDPRKAKDFWRSLMDMKKSNTTKVKLIKSHPTSISRFHNMDSLMPKAFNILAKHCSGDLHPFLRVTR